ncbi:MAG: SPOR domain-containing protein [Nonlabens sp.]
MNVSFYVAELLYRHECVIVPGLGAFVSRRVPASHDADLHVVYPPKKHLGFNAEVDQNDGLLYNHLSQSTSITYEQAQQEVLLFVNQIHKEIAERGYANISKVGQITRTEEDNLFFTPTNVVNYLPEAFGLAMQNAAPLTGVAPLKVLVAAGQENEVSAVPVSSEQPYKTSWWKYAAIGLVLLASTAMGWRTYRIETQRQDQEIATKAKAAFQNKVQQSSFLISDPLPTITLEVAPIVKTHHIVAGAFRNPANADKRISQLKKEGIVATRIGVNKYGLHNVAFSSFADRDDAINELNRLKRAGYSSAWLLSGTLEQ